MLRIESGWHGGSHPLFSTAYWRQICPIDLRLLRHCTFTACARARFSAGRSSAIRIAMMPMTTNNSTIVNACRRRMVHSLEKSGRGPQIGMGGLETNASRKDMARDDSLVSIIPTAGSEHITQPLFCNKIL